MSTEQENAYATLLERCYYLPIFFGLAFEQVVLMHRVKNRTSAERIAEALRLLRFVIEYLFRHKVEI